jgi:hypothetical protein
MTAEEITNTKLQLKEMIYSNELSNCVLACEIIKSLDWSSVEKLDFIKPILKGYQGLCSAMMDAKAFNQMDKIELMIKKVGTMNELIQYL